METDPLTVRSCSGNSSRPILEAEYIEAPDSLISGNHLTDSSVGIVVNQNSHRTIVANNVCNNNESSLMSNVINMGTSDYCTVIGNSICNNIADDPGDKEALQIYDAQHTLIVGNNISNNSNAGAGDMYGIEIYNNCTQTYVSSNIIDGNDVKIKDSGINTLGIYGSEVLNMRSTHEYGTAILLNAIGENVAVHFRIDPVKVDADANITFHFVITPISTDANIVMVKHCSSTPTDNTVGQSWDIYSAVADGINGINGRSTLYTATIPHANYNSGDWIMFQLGMNEASRGIWFYEGFVVYSKL